MSNLFENLPVPAGPGVGAPVDTSAMGRVRTVTVEGEGFNPNQPFDAAVTIEVSLDGGANWVALHTFVAPGKRSFEVAAQMMRVRLGAVTVANNMNVDVASNNDGGQFVALPAPAGNGVGGAIDVSTFGTFNSVQVTGQFSGAVIIEASEDGIDWLPCFAFNLSGVLGSKEVVAQFMRVRRSNISAVLPGLPVVSLGAINDASPIGGDYQSVEVLPRSTTTGAGFVTQASLVTPALSGRYRVAAKAFVDSTNALRIRLQNVTDGVQIGVTARMSPGAERESWYEAGEVVFTGASKTIAIQFSDQPPPGNTAGCRDARIELWRVG